MRWMLALLIGCLLVCPALAGTTYRVTASMANGRVLTYDVSFGGGRMFEQYTAFDPESQEFVYLRFNRNEEAPEPAMHYWDHTTGHFVYLYNFPGVEHPLPIIPSIQEMAYCPFTGDEDYRSQPVIAYD